MCPYMAGGRSRRGSPKAGTTVENIEKEHMEWKLTTKLKKYGMEIDKVM